MLKGFVEQISCNQETNEKNALIRLENHSAYVVPLELLPTNIEVDDFIIIDNGKISIDPDTDDKKEEIKKAIVKLLAK